jgi:nitrite reductase (NADH) small subunit
MSIVSFEPTSGILLIQGNTRYFFSKVGSIHYLFPGNCPHRGGPLHLGNYNCSNNTIVCPWHELEVPIEKLRRLAIPLISRKESAVAILPQPSTEPIVIKKTQQFAI